MTPGIVRLRQQLHSIPELSGNERLTSEKIKNFLHEHIPGIRFVAMGGYSFLAYAGPACPASPRVFRVDMDAVRGAETKQIPYRSAHPGIAHLCGHDGHSCVGVSLALTLFKADKPNDIAVLFQGAEETGQGAARACQCLQKLGITPAIVLGHHNIPGYPTGRILIKKGLFAMASSGISIEFSGRESHASEPEQAVNPLKTVMKTTELLGGIQRSRAKPDELLTLTHLSVGESGSFGTTPGRGTVQLTVRSRSKRRLEAKLDEVRKICNSAVKDSSITVETKTCDPFPPTVNDPRATDRLITIVKQLGWDFSILRRSFRWSEDFGHYTKISPTLFMGVGSGANTAPLHHSLYDYPDPLLETSSRLFSHLLEKIS